MPLTNAEKQARAYAKRKARMKRYEAALREIAGNFRDEGAANEMHPSALRVIARTALTDT